MPGDVAADGVEPTGPDWREVHPLLTEPFVVVAPRGMEDGPDAPFIQYTLRHLMGRQIAAHLARQNLRPGTRYELDSYAAILAMVAAGEGWTILTPLALLHGARFRAAVEVRPLPGAALSRSLSLSARAGVLKDIPAQVAARLKRQLQDQVVTPALAEWPWMDQLRVA